MGTASLPADKLAAAGFAMCGYELTRPKDARVVSPSPIALARLKRLHRSAGELAEDAPSVLANPQAARGLEQALIGALVDCLGDSQVREDRAPLRQHAKIMRRFLQTIEARPDEALYIPELCTAIGASERTLRVICHEQLGMGPKRYLLMRRMRLARQALRDSAPGETTVTEIATRFGFWQFGRFACEYKSLFGESPSAMLARPVP